MTALMVFSNDREWLQGGNYNWKMPIRICC